MIHVQNDTYDNVMDVLQELTAAYPGFTVLRNMGTSHDGRSIPLIRMGLGIHCLVLTAGLYGNEQENPHLLLRLIEEYGRAYQQKESVQGCPVRQLLNQCSLVILPLLNPDGYDIVSQGFSAIRNPVLRQMCKMKELDAKQWIYNARCVNLDCNFPSKTYQSQGPGEYPGSENETRALMRVFEEYETIGYLDFHSQSRVIYYFYHSLPFMRQQKNYMVGYHLQQSREFHIRRREEEQIPAGGSPVNYYAEYYEQPAVIVKTTEYSHKNRQTALAGAYGYDEQEDSSFREILRFPLEIINKT